mmetsp:Transcript_7014/g.23554  ORF Transcript_7014/g.23554 Transcript_7014/m.23554 type:complete len:273 (-) Transcript_7014:412-1230(-)
METTTGTTFRVSTARAPGKSIASTIARSEEGSGRFVSVTTNSGTSPGPKPVGYSASPAAIARTGLRVASLAASHTRSVPETVFTSPDDKPSPLQPSSRSPTRVSTRNTCAPAFVPTKIKPVGPGDTQVTASGNATVAARAKRFSPDFVFRPEPIFFGSVNRVSVAPVFGSTTRIVPPAWCAPLLPTPSPPPSSSISPFIVSPLSARRNKTRPSTRDVSPVPSKTLRKRSPATPRVPIANNNEPSSARHDANATALKPDESLRGYAQVSVSSV